MIISQKVEKKACLFCKACINICPKQAISMYRDEYGFAYPIIDNQKCINCNLCEKICKRVKSIEKNSPLQTIVGQSKDYDLSKKSSSGGLFAQLACACLDNKGVVFGCFMQKTSEQFEVKHIYIEDKKDLYKLQGSKYVQSDIGVSYQQAKEFLDNNRQVLFSGTPCQIAGLKAFLNKEYDNLLCVDLSCEGVPNSQIFNDYVKYLEENIIRAPIVDVKFRNKQRLGWNTSGLTIFYKQDKKIKEKIIEKKDSSYFSLLINMHILRENCYQCPFTGLQRISDITIADAWGVFKEYPKIKQNKIDKKQGVSLALLNSNKGIEAFEKIKENFNYQCVDANKFVKYNHPLRCPSIMTDNRERYLNIYKEKGYKTLEQIFQEEKEPKKKVCPFVLKKTLATEEKTDALLMTMYANPNYGSMLTAFALQKTLKNLGYSSKIINYEELYPHCADFYKKYCILTQKVSTIFDFYNLNKITDTFILGADNLLNGKTDSFHYITRNLFNYVKDNKKLLMISGSMGDWDGKLPHNKHKYFQALLDRFDYLSTREEHGKEVLQEVYHKEAEWLNDPIFYLDKKEYIDLAQKSQEDYSNKIMKYILYPSKDSDEICKYVVSRYNQKIISFEGNKNATHYSIFDKNISVYDWLSAIINSSIIITDSFHCAAFALVFNKKFICLKNNHAQVRFTSLFKKLGINIKIVEKGANLLSGL